MKYTDKIIVDVKTLLNGDKEIHYLGYSYANDRDDFTFVEYCGFTTTYNNIVDSNYSVKEYEAELGSEEKQYCEDVSAEKLKAIYEHYDNGKCPIFAETIDKNTPDGMYII